MFSAALFLAAPTLFKETSPHSSSLINRLQNPGNIFLLALGGKGIGSCLEY